MRKKIVFFIGSDITAHLIMNNVIKYMDERGLLNDFEPVLYFPHHKASARANLPQLKEYAMYDRGLLEEVYKFIDESPFPRAENLSPHQLADVYGLTIDDVPDVNDPAFVESLNSDPDIVAGISVRCFQIFKPEIIDVMSKKYKGDGAFVNLHPGRLPGVRGVHSPLRHIFAIASDPDRHEGSYGCTLHRIHPKIDLGDVISPKAATWVPGTTVFKSTVNMAPLAADSIISFIDDIKKDRLIVGTPQIEDPDKNPYYTYPNRRELQAMENAGVVLVCRDEVKKILLNAFSKPDTRHWTQLEAKLDAHINANSVLSLPSSAQVKTVANQVRYDGTDELHRRLG